MLYIGDWAPKKLLVADTWNGLFVVNISDLAHPVIVAHATLPAQLNGLLPDPVGGIALGDGVIYAAGISTGLHVIPAPGLASPVVVETDHAPILPPTLSQPSANPDFLSFRPDGQVMSVSLAGDVAWIACGAAGIQAVRLVDTRMEPVSVTAGKGDVFHVAVSGNRLALSRRHERIVQILDITDIARPALLREYSLNGHPGACAFWHDRVLIPAGYEGLLLEKR